MRPRLRHNCFDPVESDWLSLTLRIAAAWLCFAPAAIADDAVALLRAEFEERLSALGSIEVRYRESLLDATPPRDEPYDVQVEWLWAGGRESFWMRPVEDSLIPHIRWAYDGQRTVEFNFQQDPPGEVANALVRPFPPRPDIVNHATYSRLIGQRLKWSLESLTEAFDTGGPKLVPPEQGNPVVVFTTHGRAGDPIALRVVFNASVPGMPIRIEESIQQAARADLNPPIPARTVSNVLEVLGTIATTNPLTGQSVVMPQMARLEDRVGEAFHSTTRIDVEELSINGDTSDARFALELPFGVPVQEDSKTPGAAPRRFLAGGEAAVEKAMAARKEAVDAQLAALAAEGIKFDARPPSGTLAFWLTASGVTCVLLAAVGFAVRRKRS